MRYDIPQRPKRVPNSAIRQIREACGMSQAEFGRMLGVSGAYVQAVEIGQRPATTEFAARLELHTGAMPSYILAKKPKALDMSHKNYTAASFEKFKVFKQQMARQEEDLDKQLRAMLSNAIEGFDLIEKSAGQDERMAYMLKAKLLSAGLQKKLDGMIETLTKNLTYPD